MSSTILKEIAKLSNPNPEDYDPEDIEPDFDESSDESADDEDAGREHYVSMSKSNLRSENGLLKDVRYRGKSASRKELFDGPILEDIQKGFEDAEEEESEDKDEYDEEDEDEDGKEVATLEDFQTDTASHSSESSSEVEDLSEVEEDLDGFEENEETSAKVQDLLAKHDALLSMPLQEPVNTDAEKGKDIKLQQRLYDNLLDARIKIQKGLLAVNSLPQSDIVAKYRDETAMETLNRAKEAAYNVFVRTLELQQQLAPRDVLTQPLNLKRKFQDTSLAEISEVSDSVQKQLQVWTYETLTKWSDKVKAASGVPTKDVKKLKALDQSIIAQLKEHLSSKDKLFERTRTKRSQFTVLGSTALADERKDIIDPEIFDDYDFYVSLLKDLVERKAIEMPVEAQIWSRQVRAKTNQKDTRASKGRKLRYHEHEKIQNFMAPVEAGTWHEEQIDELFANLLGRRIQVDEGEVVPRQPVDLSDGMRIFG